MKLLYCPTCNDLVLMRPEPRTCFCGKSQGRYREDRSTVEQTIGTVSIALHNHDLRAAFETFFEDPSVWHPLMMFRAYINPHCESDVVYVARASAIPAEVAEPPPAALDTKSDAPEG